MTNRKVLWTPLEKETEPTKEYDQPENAQFPLPMMIGPELGEFNFYICETNFSVNKKIMNFLRMEEGLESVDVISKYRFRVSIGTLFAAQDIMDRLEACLIKEDYSGKKK